jgi:hypothetical protein
MTLTTAFNAISFADINVELGRSSTAEISIDTAENGGYATINLCASPKPSATNPAAISEWYSYNHLATPTTLYNVDPINGAASSALACAELEDCSRTIYTANSVYYINDSCTTVPTNGYYLRCDDRTQWVQFVDGGLASSGTCTTTTTTTTTTTLTCACNFKTGVCTSGCSNAGFACGDNSDCA